MRKISSGPIIVFSLILALAIALSVATTSALLVPLPLGDFRGIILVVGCVLFVYFYAIISYRVFLRIMPLKEGYIDERSRLEFAYGVYTLFFLVMFRSLICTRVIPVPLTRLIYLCLGARLGTNTYSTGVILDPPLTTAGANTIIGQDALLYSHAIEGKHLSLDAIRIGDNVTIGAKSVIMSGVKIGDGAIVAAGSVVLKHTQIGPGELWGGVPAQCLRKKENAKSSRHQRQ